MNIHSDLYLWATWGIFVISIFFIIVYLEKYILTKNSFSSAATVSIAWIIAAIIFNIILWYYLKLNFNQTIANQKALEFFTGYLLEKSLSLDNLFVFVLIFRYFHIPDLYQKRVLNYGIIGAIVLRILMIFFGIWLISKLHWVLYVFGAFLIFSGGKILLASYSGSNHKENLNNNLIVILCHKYLRTTKDLAKENFFITKYKKLYVTPLFLAMILIEISDIMFAADSIPAILAILNDPFIIVTSNIFAILGLRALYFFLAISVHKFSFLQQGIALLLIFIGIKMLCELHLSIVVTLSIMSIILIASILLSVIFPSKKINKLPKNTK